jgi:hypothetical protein
MADLWRAKGSQFFDSNGDPLSGGRFRYFDATTTNARAVYQDETALTAWTQPIELDAAGRLTASIYVPTGAFKETLANSADVQVYSEDNIPGAITIPDADFARPETPVIAKAANYPVTTNDLGSLFALDATGGDFTLTLPSAITAGNGATIYVVQVGTGGKITIATTGGQTINGASSFALYGVYRGGKITSDGTSWSAVITDTPYGTASKTTGYTVVLADYGKLLLCDATSAAFTVTLPAAATAGAGFYVFVKKTDSTANAITIDGNAAETVDGSATVSLPTQYDFMRLRCDGTNWRIDGRSTPLATVAEAGTGTNTVKAVTPAGLFPAEADIASATTTDIGAATTDKVRITGTTTITGFGTAAAGIRRMGRFAGALTLTHNGTSLILPGGANITTAANDRFEAYSLGSGNWLVASYTRASGAAVVGAAASQAEMEAATSLLTTSTPGRQHYHPGHPKCAAKVTVSGGTPTLQSANSYNITSITDTAEGRLTITIATDFADAHWVCVPSIEAAFVTGSSDVATERPAVFVVGIDSGGQAAGSVVLECYEAEDSSGSTSIVYAVTLADPVAWHMIGIGDQA